MDHNPYTPPSAKVEVADARRGSAVKAVILGMLADLVGSMVAGALAMAAYGAYLGATGSTPDEAATTMDGMNYDSPLGIALTIVGCLFSVLGGYVCARVARHAEYRLGAIMSAISAVLVVLSASDDARPIVTAVFCVATLASIMAGAHLGAAKNKTGR